MKKYFFILLFFISITVLPQAGSLDFSYGINGVAKVCHNAQITAVIKSKFQNTNKTVYLGVTTLDGSAGGNWILFRLNSNGEIDNTFGANGFIDQTYFDPIAPTDGYFVFNDLCVQDDNKILIMGYITSDSFEGYSVIRLMPDGALDTSFNGTGIFTQNFGFADRGYAVTLQSDGKILIAGSAGVHAKDFGLMRLNTNGTLDATFGSNGKVMTSMNPNESAVLAIEVLNDDKFIVGGYTIGSTKNITLAKFNSNGTIDTTFGTNGKVITTIAPFISDNFKKMIVKPDGKILVGGFSNIFHNSITDNGLALVQYLDNGSLDTSFDSDGIKVYADYEINDMALQADNKIVVISGENTGYKVMRFNQNATTDTNFGESGTADFFTDIIAQRYGYCLLIQPDNKIIASGVSQGYQDSFGNYMMCGSVIRLEPGVLSNASFDLGSIKVYPNPTNDIVSFDNTSHQIQKVKVFNYLGQELTTSNCANVSNPSVDLSSLPIGIYLVQLEGNETIATHKVSKE